MSHTPHNSADKKWVLAICGLCLVASLVWLCIPFLRASSRTELPDNIDSIRAPLLARHPGEGPCPRWQKAEPLSENDLRQALSELQDITAIDLRVLLPILTRVRLRNDEAERQNHGGLSARDEFMSVALEGVPYLEKTRLKADGTDLDVEWPLLQSIASKEPRARDRVRWKRFKAVLEPAELKAVDRWVEAWRVSLATPRARSAFVDYVAQNLTADRMDALQAQAERYKKHYGTYPKAFKSLLLLGKNTNSTPSVLEHGMGPDGALRDGWLRPFSYYTTNNGFVLMSEGPSTKSDEDNLVLRAEE